MCLCTMHMPCALKAQKKALGHLELELTDSCAQATAMWVLGIRLSLLQEQVLLTVRSLAVF